MDNGESERKTSPVSRQRIALDFNSLICGHGNVVARSWAGSGRVGKDHKNPDRQRRNCGAGDQTAFNEEVIMTGIFY